MASSSSRAAGDWEPRFVRPLPRAFYDRPVLTVARALIGQLVARRTPGGWKVGRIVETEAYGHGDPASHAYGGPTPRNRSMFAGPGTLYVYRIHQVYCANAVTRSGEAALLRALEPVDGRWDRPSGPGRLCRELGLDRSADGSDLTTGEVRILPEVGRFPIVRGPRIGIRRAATYAWRFALVGSKWVSSPRPGGRPRRRAT